MTTNTSIVCLAATVVFWGPTAIAAPTEAGDLEIDRDEVFEFTSKPTLTRDGDRVTISFETKGFCDVGGAIENSEGQIVRHLAHGVLGPNAPDPFKKNSRAQTIVWDGKNDSGAYVDDKESVVVPVSVGLKPRLERNLLWHPRKRMSLRFNPLMVAQPEGVYVYDGASVETIRLFGHDGKYIRTIYPFPAKDVENVKGLRWTTFAHGHKSPRPFETRSQQAYLYSGIDSGRGAPGSHAVALAVRDGSIAVVGGQFFDGSPPPQPGASYLPAGRRRRVNQTRTLRARHRLTAPPEERGELKLTLSFRGGVIVYLNGEEIARSHLPEGKIKPLTLAEPYPKEAYRTGG